jgi:hypothetical protein
MPAAMLPRPHQGVVGAEAAEEMAQRGVGRKGETCAQGPVTVPALCRNLNCLSLHFMLSGERDWHSGDSCDECSKKMITK